MPETRDAAAQPLCARDELAERGRAVVFDVLLWRQPARAFALRFDGRVVAYINRCAHVPTEMDWQPGEFLDAEQALHRLLDPRCDLRAGERPLRRRPLRPWPADGPATSSERDGQVYWYPSRDIAPLAFDERRRALHFSRARPHESFRRVFRTGGAGQCRTGRAAGATAHGVCSGAPGLRGRARAGRVLAAARPSQRATLARLLPTGLAGHRAGRAVGRLRRAQPRQRADRPAHRADRGARRDRRRQRGQRRGHGGGAQERIRRQWRAGRGAAHQLARRQPGAGRHHQRRDPAPEGAAQEEGLCGGRGDVRLGRLLHRGGCRRDLRRQGQPGRLDRRADGRLRLHRRDGKTRRRAPPADRRREQGHARPVLAAERQADRLSPRP